MSSSSSATKKQLVSTIKNVAKETSEKVQQFTSLKFYEELVGLVDKRLLVKNLTGYLVVNTINGTQVEALFTSFDLAEGYLNRIVLNSASQCYWDSCNDEENAPTEEGLNELVDAYIEDFYEILIVKHLDLAKTIYVDQCGNYKCRGDPKEYLTNDEAHWIELANKRKLDRGADKEWMKICTLKIDPSPPKISNPN